MNSDRPKHHRHSIRLQGYDYSQAGAYFLTVCAYSRECLFGEVVDGKMQLNEYGEIVQDEWMRTGVIRSDVVLDAFVVMPNHVHGIIVLVGATRRVALPGRITPDGNAGAGRQNPAPIRPRAAVSGSIGAIVGQFKSVVSRRINRLRGVSGAPVWQRNYYDHIIRNQGALDAIRRYIQCNPSMWTYDIENAGVRSPRPSAIRNDPVKRYGFTDEDVDSIVNHDIGRVSGSTR